MKKWIAVLLVLLLSAVYPAAQAERWAQIPEPLRFSQYTAERDYVKSALYVQCTYPNTANATVNQEMKELIDRMAQEGRKALPAGPYNEKRPTYLDVGAYISRSGDRFMSFLTIARIAHNTEQTYVDFDARTYDMLSGRQITLRDLFDADSDAWAQLADEVRGQLTAYYMDLIPDLTALDALCTREAIESAPITLSAAKLSLHYRTDALYPGKNNLMHVNLYYSGIRSLMNSLGQQATDNSHYKMIALTYDDGGARGSSMNVLNQLRLYGAKATFFIIGTNMVNNHDVMNRQQDADFAMASHNYEHVEHVSDKKKGDKAIKTPAQLAPSIFNTDPEPLPKKTDTKLHYTKLDWILVCALTAVYAIFAVTNLGSTNFPETEWRGKTGTSVRFVFDGQVEVYSMWQNCGITGGGDTSNFTLTGDDGTTVDLNQKYGIMYRWNKNDFPSNARPMKTSSISYSPPVVE